MNNKEKIIMYTWLGSLVIILLVGIILCLERPSEEIIQSNKEILTIVKKIRKYYSNRPDYWGLDTAEAIKQNLYTGKVKNNQIINSLGRTVNIGSDSNGTQVMPGMHSFIITYMDLNKKECMELASFSWTEEDKLSLISITIQNKEGNYEFSWGDKGLPLSKKATKQYCQEENNLLWAFE